MYRNFEQLGRHFMSRTMFAVFVLMVVLEIVRCSARSQLDAEVVDTITFPETECSGKRCLLELSVGGRNYFLHMDHTIDLAAPYLVIDDVYLNETVTHRVPYPQGCVHYGKVVQRRMAVGTMMLDLCETKVATLQLDEGEYSVVPIRQEDDHRIRRRRSADTHAVYMVKGKTRKKRNATPVIINQVVAPARFTDSPIPSYERLSSTRVLRVELALFVDKDFHWQYSNSTFGGDEKLRSHIMNVMKQVQMWYLLPSLGYKIHFFITKFVFMKNTVKEIGEYTDMTSFCTNYQSTFLPGGSREGKNPVTWDDVIYFSGVLGMFGTRSPGRYIYGRAHRWGACNPKYQCMGINDHFEISKDLWSIERYLGRLVTHELGHTFGMADEYTKKYKTKCPAGIMFSQYTGRWWSSCSVYDLEQYLISELSNCIDTMPDFRNKDLVIVDPAPPDNSTENATNGGWSQWSSFGPCSRTCDGGVKLATRKCNNPTPKDFGRVCTGFSYKMKMCNTKACSKGTDDIWDVKTTRDLYSEECAKIDMYKDFRADIAGIAGLRGTPACAHKCHESKMASRWYDYKTGDGFRCREGQDDVCVDGICMMVDCDTKSFYSTKRRDKCGVCGGKGRSCRIVSDTYRGQEVGWQIVKILPNGSRNIHIELNAANQKAALGNIIELAESDAPTNSRAEVPTRQRWVRRGSKGAYNLVWGGVMWEYLDDKSLPHILRTRYRLQEDVLVWLKRAEGAASNPGIKWSYTIDEETPEVTPIVPIPDPSSGKVPIIGGGSRVGAAWHGSLVMVAVLLVLMVSNVR